MAVILVGGFVVIAVELINRMVGPATDRTFTATIDLPDGATVAGVSATASRAIIHAKMPDGSDRVVVVDPASGAVLGTIDLGTDSGAGGVPDQ